MSFCTYIKIEGKKDKKAFRRFKKDLKRVLRQIKKETSVKWASGHDLLSKIVLEQIYDDYQYYKEDGFDMCLRVRVCHGRYLLYGIYNEQDDLDELFYSKPFYKVRGNVWGAYAYGKKN